MTTERPLTAGSRSIFVLLIFLGTVLANTGCGPSAAEEKEAIQKLKDLGALVIVTDGHASALNLSNVEPKGNSIGDAMPWTTKLAHLQSFNAANSKISDADLETVGKLRTIGDLNLQNTGVTDAGVAHLAKLDRVETLYLSGTPITGTALSTLGKLGSLKTLGISDTKTTGGYQGLAANASLQRLIISNVELTDADATAISSLPALNHLDMDGATVSDAGLAEIRAKVKLVNH